MSASRSEALHMQNVFKVCLDAMARPGLITTLPSPLSEEVRYPGVTFSLVMLIDAFVDQATSIALVTASAELDTIEEKDKQPANSHLEQVIMAETHARVITVGQADFIAVFNNAEDALVAEAVLVARGGTLASPETGATLFIECDLLASKVEDTTNLFRVSVKGPGVKDEHFFGIDRISWLEARNKRCDEFPCGIDIILVDRVGGIVAIPRTSFISLTDNLSEAN